MLTLTIFFASSKCECFSGTTNDTSNGEPVPKLVKFPPGGLKTALTASSDGSSFKPCPAATEPEFCAPWHYCVKEECKFGHVKRGNHSLSCCSEGSLLVRQCYCLTYNTRKELMEVGQRVFSCNYQDPNSYLGSPYRTVPNDISALNGLVCDEFNRQGTLCGQCKENYVLSTRVLLRLEMCGMCCWRCKHVEVCSCRFFPFSFAVLFFKINVTSSPLYGFVYCCQSVTTPMILRGFIVNYSGNPRDVLIGSIATLYGVWNLDFFRLFNLNICLGTGTLVTLALDLVVAVYPLLLMVLSYILITLYDHNFRLLVFVWKPFRRVFSLLRKNWNIRTSLIDSFATFILLSNTKFLSVAYDLLLPVEVDQLSPTGHFSTTRKLYYDATIDYFGSTHRDAPLLLLYRTCRDGATHFPILLLRCHERHQ